MNLLTNIKSSPPFLGWVDLIIHLVILKKKGPFFILIQNVYGSSINHNVSTDLGFSDVPLLYPKVFPLLPVLLHKAADRVSKK